MRWGVRDEATDDHMTTELCMREIENCQRLSMGPNFVVCFFTLTINTNRKQPINVKLFVGVSWTKIRISSNTNVCLEFRVGNNKK